MSDLLLSIERAAEILGADVEDVIAEMEHRPYDWERDDWCSE